MTPAQRKAMRQLKAFLARNQVKASFSTDATVGDLLTLTQNGKVNRVKLPGSGAISTSVSSFGG